MAVKHAFSSAKSDLPDATLIRPTDWNADHVVDILDGCRVYNSANISIPDDTDTILTFDSERYDNGGLHSTSTNTSRITFANAGIYHVGGCIIFTSATTGTNPYRELDIRLNGTTTICTQKQSCNFLVASVNITVGTIYKFAANDFVELMCSQRTGGSLDVVASGNQSPEFWAQFITV